MIEITLPSIHSLILWFFSFLALIVLVAWAFFCIRRWLRYQLHDPRDREFIAEEWKKIELLAQTNNEASLQMAVMQSDKLLDHILKSMMMPGSTLGERLKVASAKYPELKDVWWAHKVRNTIVHEPSSHSSRKLHQALKEFETAFRKLGAL